MNGSLFCHPDKSDGDLHLIVTDLRRSPRDQTLILLPPTRKINFLTVTHTFSRMRNNAVDIDKTPYKKYYMRKDIGKSA